METKIKKERILLVDDELDIRDILQFNLENEGYIIDSVASAEEALDCIKLREKEGEKHQLLLLDVMMGGMSGFKFAVLLRKAGNMLPIIFLTAKDTENDMLTGFSIGGDDYIPKPFSIKEVIARVRSILKRTEGSKANEAAKTQLQIESLLIDLETQTVHIDSNALDLTRTEYNILVLLVQYAGRTFSRTEILNKAWGKDAIVLDRTVDVHIARLRKKIGKYGEYIINRTGYGYSFKC